MKHTFTHAKVAILSLLNVQRTDNTSTLNYLLTTTTDGRRLSEAEQQEVFVAYDDIIRILRQRTRYNIWAIALYANSALLFLLSSNSSILWGVFAFLCIVLGWYSRKSA